MYEFAWWCLIAFLFTGHEMTEWGTLSAISLDESSVWHIAEGWACHLQSHAVIPNIVFHSDEEACSSPLNARILRHHSVADRSFATFPPVKTIKLRTQSLGALISVLHAESGVTVSHIIEALRSWYELPDMTSITLMIFMFSSGDHIGSTRTTSSNSRL